MKWSPLLAITPRSCLRASFGTNEAMKQLLNMDPSTAMTDVKSLFKQGKLEEGLKLLDLMHKQGLHPACDDTYVYLLRQCTSMIALADGRRIHDHIARHTDKRSMTLSYTIFCMYAKCGSLVETRAAFDQMVRRNVVAWTLMINEYAKHGPALEALTLYHRMIQEGASPNNVTYLCLLKACAHLGVMDQGKHIHVHVIMNSSGSDVSLGNALVDMYAKCGSVEEAQYEFDRLCERTVVSWNSLIAGYVKHTNLEHAFVLFAQMELNGAEPDAVTFLSILKACASSRDLTCGKLIHSNILKRKFEAITFVGNALVDMYCKCESLEDARRVFQHMDQPHLGAWNALIGGYAQLGHAEQAFELFNAMKLEKLEPGKVTFLSVLKASADLAALEQGSTIHTLIRQNGLESDLFVASNLVDMHAKCGNLEEAQVLFDRMSSRSLVTWNTLIAGYALHGQAEEAFKLSWKMEKEGMSLNHVTFVGLLFACSHAGLVEEGCKCFDSISQVHGFLPLMEHYCCMVDVLGRAGCLEEAIHVIKKMPFEPSGAVWKALLGACRVCSDIGLAKNVAECLEPQDNAAFVLLSNIYAAGAGWEDINSDSEV